MSLEIKNHLEALNQEVRGFKATYAAKLDALQAQADETQKAMQRRGPGIGREGSGGGSETEELRAFNAFLRGGDGRKLAEVRASMSSNDDPSGGYAVPRELADQIAKVELLHSPLRGLANVVKSDTAAFEQLVSTTAAGAEWVGETATRSETDTPSFGSVRVSSGELSSVAPITRWLLDDAKYDLTRFLTEEIGRAHGVSEGAAFMAGNGINKPLGILAHSLAETADASRAFGVIEKLKSGSSGDFDADDLIDLIFKLKPEYRANASFLMGPTTLAKIRKLKASASGDYIWQPAAAAGQPSTLFGAPVFEDPNVPAVAADANAVLVGDFRRGYTICDIGQPVLIRDDLTQKGKVLFYVARRVGGAVIDSNAIKVLTLSA